MSSQKDFSKIESQQSFISLLNAASDGKLPNSNLIVSADSEACDFAAQLIAGRLLAVDSPEECVDFFHIRPGGAMNQISVDQIRELRAKIYLSPKICEKKFVLISCAECMNAASANAFLKTLEEPPSDTVIFLTTSRPYSILPTITGRCSITRLHFSSLCAGNKELSDWLDNYFVWLTTTFESSYSRMSDVIMRAYGLLSKLEALVESLCAADKQFENKRDVYAELLVKIENQTADFFRKNLKWVKYFPKVVEWLEDKPKLIALNANFMSCVEAFFMEICQLSLNLPGKE